MKKTFIAFVVIAASFTAASCQKENALANGGQSSSSSPVFTASIDNEIGTKTTIEKVAGTPVAYKVAWEATDKISVNGAVYAATPDGSDPTKATFTKESGEDPTGVIHAYYPSIIFDGTVGTLPAVQTYAAGKFNAPMYAESTSTSLSFKNICATLAITVNNSMMATVKKIRVSSTNCALSGEFIINASTGKVVLLHPDAYTNTVILDCGEGVATTAEGTVFYIFVPSQTYKNLAVELSSDGTLFTKGMKTKVDQNIPVSENTVYSFTFAASPLYYVEGTYSGFGTEIDNIIWAPVNCGYDAVNYIYGKIYQWGRKYGSGYKTSPASPYDDAGDRILEGHTVNTTVDTEQSDKWYWGSIPRRDWKTTKDNARWNSALSPNDAAQTGQITPTKTENDPCPEGWRVPTYYELNTLSTNHSDRSSKDGHGGYYFSGTTAYSPGAPSLFLPMGGFRRYDGAHTVGFREERGVYWSSTVKGDYAYSLYTDLAVVDITDGPRGWGYNIRCVKQ